MRAEIATALGILVVLSSNALGREDPFECPEDMVPTGKGTCIDRFEFPNLPGVKPKLGVSAIATPEDLKNGRVNDAERLCVSVGKRACTANEWVSACKGPGGSKYPFGEELPLYIPGTIPGECNYDKWFIPPDADRLNRGDKKEYQRLDQSEPAGSRSSCRSRTGAYDMVGNAEEWVKCSSSKFGWCLMGRFWSEPESCTFKITAHSPRWSYYETGFRCCKDAE